MRPKTKIRLIIIIAGALLLGGVLTGWWSYSRAQNDAKLKTIRDAGMAAFKQGDYIGTLDQLKLYIGKRTDDAEALYAYAKSRSAVTMPNGKHILEGANAYRRYLLVRPDDDVARHELLRLYEQTQGFNTETLAVAAELLAKDPKDADALRAKSVALVNSRRLTDALEPSMQYNAFRPTDLEAQCRTITILFTLEKPTKELLDRAELLRKQNPGDVRFDVLLGFAYMAAYERDKTPASRQRAIDLITDAGKKDAPDVQFAKVTSNLLDRLNLAAQSLDLLQRASHKSNDPGMMLLLVQRLWQKNDFESVTNLLKDVSPTSAQSDTRLLAYKALSLAGMKKLDEAKPIVDALAARQDDSVAIAWAMALRTRYFDSVDPKTAIEQYSAALVRDRENSVICYMIGESYAKLGENELAMQYWASATKYAPTWITPRVQTAELLGNTGRAESALQASFDAFNQSRTPVTESNLAVAAYKNLVETGDDSGRANLLEFVADIQKRRPGDMMTLPIYAALLADPKTKTANPENVAKAKQIINDILKSDAKFPEEIYISLAKVSRVADLGLDEALFDKSEKINGLTPLLAANRALRTYIADGNTKAALPYLLKAADDNKHTKTWDLALARFREITRDPGAKDAWIALADANANDLNIQSAALNASSPWTQDPNDRKFLERTIDRLRKLTGDEGMAWRQARARWLLSNTGNRDRDTAEAIVTLSDIIKGSNRSARPLMDLADAMEQAGNFSGALEKNREAAIYSPQSADIGLRLIQRLHIAGKFDEAREQALRVGKLSLNSDQFLNVSKYMAMQGMSEEGLALLSKRDVNDTDSLTLKAEVFRENGDMAEAEKIYKKLLALPTLPSESIISAAGFYALRGDTTQAQTLLARLDTLKLKPGERELLLGAFNEAYFSKTKALEMYIAATKAASSNEAAWIQLLGFYVREGRYDEAIAASPEAAKALPGNEGVAGLRRTAEVFKAHPDRQDLGFLARMFSRDPGSPAVLDTLTLIEDVGRGGMTPEQSVSRTRQSADRNPQFLPLQIMLTQSLLDANRVSDATDNAARAMKNFPVDAEVARAAVKAYATANNNQEMLQAAQKWRDRTLGSKLLPDRAIAEAYLRLNKPAEAADQLQPYIEEARIHPDDNADLMAAYCRALIKAGKSDDAAKALFPLAQKSSKWRGIWVGLGAAAQNDYPSSKAWLERVAPSMSDAVDEQIVLAQGWFQSGKQFNMKEAFERARDILKPLAARTDVKTDLPILYAMASEEAGDPAGAEAGYRAALKIDPKAIGPQNNLAYLLLVKGGDLSEAKELATKATSNPSAPATYFDTLGRILLKSNDRAGALNAFDAALQRDPKTIEAMIGKANVLMLDGKVDRAGSMVQQIDALTPNPAVLPANLRAELDSVRSAVRTSASTDEKPVTR